MLYKALPLVLPGSIFSTESRKRSPKNDLFCIDIALIITIIIFLTCMSDKAKTLRLGDNINFPQKGECVGVHYTLRN